MTKARPGPVDTTKWLRLERWWWTGMGPGGGIAAALPKPWPREALLMHLRWLSDRAIWDGMPVPSRRRLAAEAGWDDGRVRTLLRHEEWWLDPRYVEAWKAVRPRRRTAAASAPLPPAPAAPAPAKERKARPRPAVPSWDGLRAAVRRLPALRTLPLHELRDVVARCAEAILGRSPSPEDLGASTRPVLQLLSLRASGAELPDLGAFVDDVELVARAARDCPMPVFRRFVRGHGMPDGVDRCRSVPTICATEPWPERLAAARAWARHVPRARPAGPVDAATQARIDEAAALWPEVWRRHVAGEPLAELEPEDRRRRAALTAAAEVLGLGDTLNYVADALTADEAAAMAAVAEQLAGAWAAMYGGGPEPPE